MPRRRGPLTVEEAEAYRVQAPEWVLRDVATRIERTYRFMGFGGAFAFVRAAGEFAGGRIHHPDISFGWGYAKVSLQRTNGSSDRAGLPEGYPRPRS